jgi:FkbM family methyltransferase
MKLTKDSKLWVPDADDYFTIGFEKIITKKVLAHLEPKGTFLDIGANVGLWTIRLAEHFNKVYAVEPVSEHVKCLHKNFELYDINNAEVLPIAASDQLGESQIRLTGHNCGRASLNFTIKTGVHETVTLFRLDDLINETDISFIKMDVEGHEISALKGMTRILKNNNPIIFIEVLKRELRKEHTAIDLLHNLGYRIIEKYGDNYLLKRDEV